MKRLQSQKVKICVLMTVLLIFSGGFNAFAASTTFSDINEAPWAKEYIIKMADAKIISGYFDETTLKATFKPNQQVTYVEAVQMIYNTLKAASKLKTTASVVSKQEGLLKSNNIPQWAYEAIAYALEYNIVHPDDLKSFMKNGKQEYAKREDVAIFIGKALNMDELIDPLPILDFVDAEMIKSIAVPYVDLLVKKGIVTGDTQKRFNPTKSITRAEMAVMCSKTYDLLKNTSTSQPSTPTETTITVTLRNINTTAGIILVRNDSGEQSTYDVSGIPIEQDGEYKTLFDLQEGDILKLAFSGDVLKKIIILESAKVEDQYPYIIDYVNEDTQMLVVKDDQGKTKVYSLKDVSIYIDGKGKRTKDLRTGYRVDLVFDSAGNLIRLNANTDAETVLEGTVYAFEKIDTDYYILTVAEKGNTSSRKEFVVDEDTEVRYKGSKNSLSLNKIQEGQWVEVEYVGDTALKVIIDDEEIEYMGILEDSISFGKTYPILMMRDNDGNLLELKVDEDAKVRRDSKKADLYDLAKGDIVSVTVENGKVTDIVATSRTKKSTAEGTIRQIVIANPSKITIYDEDLEEEVTYEISNSVDVEIDGKDADLKDLELRYYVELRIENGLVTEIDAEKSAGKDTITGKIDRIYPKYNRLIVKYYDERSKQTVRVSVEVTSDTRIIGASGETIRLNHLKEGSEVFINGHEDDDLFIADKIIELD
ncbi:MAG TPA: S-layer homology domain-containing protein [Clostridiales bacterium]|nr:S-layer homology domain-containing protein [Clostridiales bacterium]